MVSRVGRLLIVVWAVALVGAASLQRGESTWPSYGGSQASLKYSPLDQIDRSNAGRMTIAWRWRSIDEDKKQPAGGRPWLFEATPLMIGSTLYVSTGLAVRAVGHPKQTGADVVRVDLPANATGSPTTYMIGGRQFIVVAVGGSNLPAELVALALE